MIPALAMQYPPMRSSSTYGRAAVERDEEVSALDNNDELDLPVAEPARDELGVEHPVSGG